jgi:hypothetical protein
MKKNTRATTTRKGLLIPTIILICFLTISDKTWNGKFVVAVASTTTMMSTASRRKQPVYGNRSMKSLHHSNYRWSAIPTTSMTDLPPIHLRIKDQSTWIYTNISKQFPTQNALLDDIATLKNANHRTGISRLKRFKIPMAVKLIILSLLSKLNTMPWLASIPNLPQIPCLQSGQKMLQNGIGTYGGNAWILPTVISPILTLVKTTVQFVTRHLERFLWWEFWRIVWKWSTPLLWDMLFLSNHRQITISKSSVVSSPWLRQHGGEYFDGIIRRGIQKLIQKWIEKAVEHNLLNWIGSFGMFLLQIDNMS